MHREFPLLWYGKIFTSMAIWMNSIARGWVMHELTHSSFQMDFAMSRLTR